MQLPELLAPGGNLEKAQIALLYGADAVYIGGSNYGLRAQAGNFTLAEMATLLQFAHQQGKKVYVTVNIYAQNRHFPDLSVYQQQLADLQVDGILISDPGIFALAKKIAPTIPLHISTQANIQNTGAAAFWAQAGASRVVLGREVGGEDIAAICHGCNAEIEVFVHGAMCMAYSGRCLLSSHFTGRSANLGDCAQPCRWRYTLEEEKRPGEHLPIEEDLNGTYIMNSKDLCLLPHLAQLIQAGVASLKIEGRMKSAYYVANIVRIYRQALDAYQADPAHFQIEDTWLAELDKVSHRPYTEAFFQGGTDTRAALQYTTSAAYIRGYDFSGLVIGYQNGYLQVEQRNHLAVGDELEIIIPTGGMERFTIKKMLDEQGQTISAAPHAKQHIRLSCDHPLPVGSILRRPVRERG